MRLSKGEKLVFIGDSITYAERAYPVGEGRAGALGNGYVALFDAMLQVRHPELGVRVVNMGDKGHTTRDMLARWQRDVLDLHPDRVVLMIGTNDVWRRFDRPAMTETHVDEEEYAANLEELCRVTLPFVKEMVVMTPFFLEPLRKDAMRAAMDVYGGIARSVAERHGLVCVDTQAAVDRLLAHVHSSAIAWDRVHPSTVGHYALADALYEALEGMGAERSIRTPDLGVDESLLVVGDSITDCGRMRPVGEGKSGALGDGYVSMFDAMLQVEHPELRVRVVNMGVSGDTTRELKARWQRDVLDLHPGRVVLLIGTNDAWRNYNRPYLKESHIDEAEYAANLEELIQATLPSVKSMTLMTPFYLEPLREDELRARMDQFGAIVKETARRHGLVCVDSQAAVDRLLEHMHSSAIAWDRVHPNAVGHFALAEALYAALRGG